MIFISIPFYLWNAKVILQPHSPGALKHFVDPKGLSRKYNICFVFLVSLVNFVLTENSPPLYVDIIVLNDRICVLVG